MPTELFMGVVFVIGAVVGAVVWGIVGVCRDGLRHDPADDVVLRVLRHDPADDEAPKRS